MDSPTVAASSKPPLIVDVKRGATEDGPGLRSVVFFKGCPLRCCFCQNPETQDPRPEIAFRPNRCSSCGACAAVCPSQAATVSEPGRIVRDRCTRCGRCAEICPNRALRRIGKRYEPDELVELLLRDEPYYRHSGGGVTLSGGECALYPHYLEAVLGPLKQRGVHVLLETCGEFDYEVFSGHVLPHLDQIYFDVKFADPVLHRRYTGLSNARIVANLRRLAEHSDVETQPRTPWVPGLTATDDSLAAIAELVSGLRLPDLQLLPYNPLGLDMYEALGRPRPALPDHFVAADRLREALRPGAH